MYTVVYPIPVFPARNNKVLVDGGLARDFLTHHRYESQLRLIFPSAPDIKSLKEPFEIDLDDYPGLSFRFLPWSGSIKTLPLRLPAVRSVLIEEAQRASVWHTCCSTNFWDLTNVSFEVGRKYAKGLRVFCLDSDPAAMLETSGGWSARIAPLVRSRYRQWVSEVDSTIFVGKGVEQQYGHLTRHSVLTGSVWLQDGDLATAEATRHKYDQSPEAVVRLIVPTRLSPWKGVDDVIEALLALGDRLPHWQLDVMGDGIEKPRLMAMARNHADRIHFKETLPYGPQFFGQLRTYHLVFVPTRGLEEARIAYDAAASGCALIHSETVTLESALAGLAPRWNFQPGNVESLKDTILNAFAQRNDWVNAGLAGIEFMSGRTIDEMHRIRVRALQPLRNLPALAC